MKLWTDQPPAADAHTVDTFTAGRDRALDLLLAPHDALASIAHVRMLASAGLLSADEAAALGAVLRHLHARMLAGDFRIEDGVEDVHSQVELELTRRLGDAGKRVHTGRSRNDQVLTDIKLFLRDEIRRVVQAVQALAMLLLERAEAHRRVPLPGYTHLQVAMPSSFGLWFGAWAECLAEDLGRLRAAYELADLNPLGSAAGYGSSFPLDRERTTALLCFRGMHVNAVAAQMSRGRTERSAAEGLAAVAATLARLAMDAVLFLSQNFAFFSLPADLSTGSSIMPHKKNPDLFELVRARCNRLQALPNDVALVTANLPSGYHRDLQVLKELLFPAFAELHDCLAITTTAMRRIEVRDEILDDERYRHVFSVDAVNALVQQGTPFRDAYRIVAARIAAGEDAGGERLLHTHTGSIDNPRNDLIEAKLRDAVAAFGFERLDGLAALLTDDSTGPVPSP
jgi:argininosuccinate lyase